MSWLYTIVFTGLVLASSGSAAKPEACTFERVDTAQTQTVDETEKFEQTYPLNANGRVNVSNVNGSITVEAWDRNEVSLQYTKIADTKDRLADVDVRIDSRADYFSVETDYGDWKKNSNGWKSGKLTVEMKLMVPRGAVLNEIETVNGSVAVSNFTNFAKVSAVNGSVKATNLRGTARLSTVNGEVAADFDRLDSGSKISLDTVNGRVNLVIPSDANATVKADSLNGNISNDFGLPVRKGKYVGRDLYGKLGGGDVQIKLSSVNGALAIGRKNDGKPLSPAVNLLTKKDADDEDWDKDNNDQMESAIKSVKMNKDIAKAVADSQKVSAKALADAQVEISKIQPEIAKITTESMAVVAEQMANSAAELKSQNIQRRLENAQIAQLDSLARIADVGFSGGFPRIEKKSESFVVKGTPKVTVNAPGCSVKVRGWDKSEVQYRVTQFAEPRNRTPLKINEDHNDSAVTVNVENTDARPGSFNGGNRVNVEIYVPRKSNLKITANGELRVEGVSGDVELVGSDEPIDVRDVEGKLRVSNSDGIIRVIGFRGDVDAQTSDGIINLEGEFGQLRARGSDGTVNLTLPETTSADLDVSGDEIKSEGIELTRLSSGDETNKYRIGNGGAKFQIQTDGEVHVRGAGVLRQTF